VTGGCRPANPIDGLLSERQVQVLAWVYYDGRSHRQVADLLAVTRQAVGKTVAAALRKLERAGLPLPQRPRDSERRRLRYYSMGGW
jgi:DNA-binding MarR family transcriptional regulator